MNRTKETKRLRLSAREQLLIRQAIEDRIRQLRQQAGRCLGDLYPVIYTNEADELSGLLDRLHKGQ